jgi:biotin synthase
MIWEAFAQRSLQGGILSRAEAGSVLSAAPEETLALVAAAERVRRHYFGNRVRLNYLCNAKSGGCPEDCHYCSQSKEAGTPIQRHGWLPVDETVRMAGQAVAVGARRFCMAASGRAPSSSDIEHISACVKAVRARYPDLEICCSLGFLSPSQAARLKAAGVQAANHNLNTSSRFYSTICHTHTFEDRRGTIQAIREAGLGACSGALVGMGESDDDILDLAFELRRLDVESVPVNFLMPLPGTPLEGKVTLTPTRCLAILGLFRFVIPRASLRISAGREIHLRSLQALGLYVADSIFVGDYLTAKGQSVEDDLAMIEDMGFEIEGRPPHPVVDRKALEVVLK